MSDCYHILLALEWNSVKELQIVPRAGYFDAVWIAQSQAYSTNLDLDDIPVYGEKPQGWKASGRRIKRGLYRSESGIEFNADINGAIGIARKVAEQYEFQFDARGFARGVLTVLVIYLANINLLYEVNLSQFYYFQKII